MPNPDPDCIFCKIVAGQIPAHKILEDEHTLAFLDVNPLAHAHTLVIPKQHYVTIDQMPPDEFTALTASVHKTALAILKATPTTEYNILQNNGPTAGQAVFHVHFHIIPRSPNDNLGYRWNPTPLNHDTAPTLANEISSKIT